MTYIDSSGIGELVSAFTTVTNQGGTLKLLGLTKRVKDLLQITKLYTVFDVHEEEAHALRSFAAPARVSRSAAVRSRGQRDGYCDRTIGGYWRR